MVAKQKSIIVQHTPVHVILENELDYICITDMANAKENESRAADIIKNWIRNRYTLEFLGTWEQMYNPNFKVVEFDHFKMQAGLNSFVLSVSEWIEKTLAKVNYHIHTDAIKENLIPAELTKQLIAFVYANEADMLNVALFGKTAFQWRTENPDTEGNIRDMATLEQLVVLSNLESINAVLIQQGLTQTQRLRQLNQIAISQMKSLVGNMQLRKLK